MIEKKSKLVIHDLPSTHGAGKTDVDTGRYIPMMGGSQSRLPVGDNEYPRYPGFVGIDYSLTPKINSMGALYSHIGGYAAYIPGGALAASIEELIAKSDKRSK